MKLDWFLPHTSSQRDLTKAKIVSLTCLSFSVITFLLWPTSIFFSHSDFPFLVISIAMLLLAFLLKFSGSIVLVGNMLSGLTYLAFISLIPSTGGIFSEDLHSMFIVPLGAFVLVGFRSGMIWTAISAITIGYFYFASTAISGEALLFRAQLDQFDGKYYLVIASINILIACVLSNILIRENRKLVEHIEGQKSDLEKTNAKLIKTEAKLKHRNNELNKFTSIVSHDLQQPVRTVQNFSTFIKEHLEENEPADSPQLNYINFIEESTDRMKLLITDLLDYARSTNKQKDFHFTALDDILNEVVLDLDNQIRGNDVLIKRNPLPKLNVIPVRIYQVFQNLISNALKFKKKNQQCVIEIFSIEKETETIIGIKDNGIGIKEDHLIDIFQPFKKLHSKVEYEGSGIGLSTCQNIVDLHNGKLWVESEYENGTTFFFSISNKLKSVPKVTGQRERSS